jgi:hypothetical protein
MHWQLTCYCKHYSILNPSLLDPVSRLHTLTPSISSRVRCLSPRALNEVVRPLLHRIGRKTEE